MTQWIVLASVVGGNPSKDFELRTLGEVKGSPEDAQNALLEAVNNYADDVWKVTRRQVFKCSDSSYLVRVEGRVAKYEYLIQLAEQVADTESAELPDTVE
ncbi:hypothetical protein ABT010_33435 [Streptomyces sp. NPDC002668]|uniref:hypothetical protein n=1 Tax=Streptomyces sp. NPDC002668 TaxID=3154422 RepID=UPI00331DE65D